MKRSTIGSSRSRTRRARIPFSAGKRRVWSDTQLLDIPPAWNYTVPPDAKRLVLPPRPELTADQKGGLQVTFFLNFFDDVRRRVPKASK